MTAPPRVEPGDLATQAAAWSGRPAIEIDAAIDSLQLTGEAIAPLRAEEIAELEDRAHRLALRPLPRVDGQLLIAPWLAHAALDVYANYLGDSRLPHPRQTLPHQVEHLMQQRRQQQNSQLEHDVRAIVTELALPHRFRFTRRDSAAAGIPGLPGEIDLLIADADHHQLWVCEVKDPHTAYSPPAVSRHIRGFTKTWNGHVTKLLNKADVISDHVAAAAGAYGVTTTQPWVSCR